MYPYGKSYPAAATYSADDDYRYGFNGMEKAKEVDDNTNYTHFRNLDLDLGRWWSRDPEELKYVGMSPYVSMGNNPILFNDARGDVLHSRSNFHSLSDVKSIVMEKNRSFIDLSLNKNGSYNVELNFKDLSKQQIDAVLANDKGLTLLANMTDSQNNINIRSENGDNISLDLNTLNPPQKNASDNGKDSRNKLTYLPPTGYNGHFTLFDGTNMETSDFHGDKGLQQHRNAGYWDKLEKGHKTYFGS